MAKCPSCLAAFLNENGCCPSCGYRSDGQFLPGNDSARPAGQNDAGAPWSAMGEGQPVMPPVAPIPPVSPVASFNPSNDAASSGNPGYFGGVPGQNRSSAGYYPPFPNGGSTGGDGNLPGKWYRNKKTLLTVIIGAVAAIALVSGVAYAVSGSPKPKPTVVSSPDTTTTTPSATETPTPEITQVKLPASFAVGDKKFDSRWGWQGGAMVTKIYRQGEPENREFYFQVWAPQLKDQVADCVFSPAQNGEKMTDEKISVTATYGDKPTIFAVYTVITKAVGTSPETVHLYAQELDLPSCKAKDRIDLQTESDNVVNDRQDYEYEVIGKSRTKIAVVKTWVTKPDPEGESRRHEQVVSISVGEKKATSLQEAEGENYRIAVPPSSTNDVYMIAADKRRFYSIDDNKLLFELPLEFGDGDNKCYADNGMGPSLDLYKLSADKYVYACYINQGKFGLHTTFFITASTGEAVPITNSFKLSEDNPYASAHYQQFKDGSLLINSIDSKQVFHIDTDGKASEILDSAQWERLLHDGSSEVGDANYLKNQFYAKTTDEIISVDLNGKSVDTLESEPSVASGIDSTQFNWIGWVKTDKKYQPFIVLTTGALPDESEKSD